MSARENILRRLVDAQRGRPSTSVAPLPDIAAWRDADADATPDTLLERFKTAIQAAHAEVHETDEAGWPDLLARLAASKGLRNLLYGAETPHGRELQRRTPVGLSIVPYDRPAPTWKTSMFEGIDTGLTAARSAIAATGSLILWPDAREPRLLSLVPPVHFVLLDAAAIHPNLAAAMHAEQWTAGMPTNALVISGPSKTADIQQTLAYGAHGPRELIVLLCHRSGGAA